MKVTVDESKVLKCQTASQAANEVKDAGTNKHPLVKYRDGSNPIGVLLTHRHGGYVVLDNDDLTNQVTCYTRDEADRLNVDFKVIGWCTVEVNIKAV